MLRQGSALVRIGWDSYVPARQINGRRGIAQKPFDFPHRIKWPSCGPRWTKQSSLRETINADWFKPYGLSGFIPGQRQSLREAACFNFCFHAPTLGSVRAPKKGQRLPPQHHLFLRGRPRGARWTPKRRQIPFTREMSPTCDEPSTAHNQRCNAGMLGSCFTHRQ